MFKKRIQLITVFFNQLEETVVGGQWMRLCENVWIASLCKECWSKPKIACLSGQEVPVQTHKMWFCLVSWTGYKSPAKRQGLGRAFCMGIVTCYSTAKDQRDEKLKHKQKDIVAYFSETEVFTHFIDELVFFQPVENLHSAILSVTDYHQHDLL